jgi:hypothetical protein
MKLLLLANEIPLNLLLRLSISTITESCLYHSKLPSTFCINYHQLPYLYNTKVKKLDKADGGEVNKAELIKIELLMNPVIPASKYSRQFVIFKDGC